ncbi:tRNA-splicing endonuclease subunit [Entomortierella beljakovae]|nr:tRNA-splicing endonuclease subunit [Entomortierella beljakovae]
MDQRLDDHASSNTIPLHTGDGIASELAGQTLSKTECTMDASPHAAVKPRVYLSGREALVWDVNDVRLLRQSYRILGSLAGSLPRSSMQNIFQGLPLRLSLEEVYALWSSGFADLVDESKSYHHSSHSTEIQAVNTGSASGSKRNLEYITIQTTSSGLAHFYPAIIKSFDECNTDNDSKDERNHIARIDFRNGSTGSTLLWQYPVTVMEELQCLAFNCLWSSYKFFIAPGMKFGGDYLLYRKDPLICHASLIASVTEADTPLPLIDLASKARLATTVQKQHLLCSLNQQHTSAQNKRPSQRATLHNNSQSMGINIIMITIEWAGF